MSNNQGVSGKPDVGAQAAGTAATEYPQGGAPGKRHEVGNAETSRLHPPHVTENAEDAPIQGEHENPTEIPTLPANASGDDSFTADVREQGIDDASMYDRRPSEDKDRPPSAGAGA